MNKKGQAVSLNLVTSIAIGLFILAMVMIAIIAGGSKINESNLFTNDDGSGTLTNVSINLTNDGNIPTALQNNNLKSITLTVTNVTNQTKDLVATGNYTVTGTSFSNATAGAPTQNYNHTTVYVYGNYTYKIDSGDKNISAQVLSNVSTGGTEFFENADTFFAILAIVIILGFIGFMIFVVTRFRGGSGV